MPLRRNAPSQTISPPRRWPECPRCSLWRSARMTGMPYPPRSVRRWRALWRSLTPCGPGRGRSSGQTSSPGWMPWRRWWPMWRSVLIPRDRGGLPRTAGAAAAGGAGIRPGGRGPALTEAAISPTRSPWTGDGAPPEPLCPDALHAGDRLSRGPEAGFPDPGVQPGNQHHRLQCSDRDITRTVVDMKAEIEKIREQIQNIE